MKKNILSLVVLLAIIVAYFPIIAHADNKGSGTCGDNLTWTLDDTGTLTISGKGDMGDCWHSPWDGYKDLIKKIKVQNGVTSISTLAFYGCNNAREINIASSIEKIGAWAFDNTAFYEDNSNWQNDVLYIGNYLIKAKENLFLNYSINEGTICIADNAFENCSKLQSVIIPNSIKMIPDNAFSESGLTSITLTNNITRIGDSAFRGCDGLTAIDIPNSVTFIGSFAFDECSSLMKVHIGKGLKVFGTETINDDKYGSLFDDCTLLKEIIVDNDNMYFATDEHGVLFDKRKTALLKYPVAKTDLEYKIPSTVKTIKGAAFKGCRNIVNVAIPKSVYKIGVEAFAYSIALKTVYIPHSVKQIDDYAFGGCERLQCIYYDGSLDEWYQIGGDYVVQNDKTKIKCNDTETKPYIKSTSNTKKGKAEADTTSNKSKPYYENTVSKDSTIYGDYIIRDSYVSVNREKALNVTGKIIIENGSLYIENGATASSNGIEIKSGGSLSVAGKLTSNGAVIANGGSNTGNGGKIDIYQKGEMSAGDISLYDYAEMSLYGKLYTNNFLIQTKSNSSDLGSTGELWLNGNFTQKKNGALWWQSGKDNFRPRQGFSLILETSNIPHNINFDTPDQSYLYNLYRVTNNGSTNQWTGNPSIRGRQCEVYKNGLGNYVINKNDKTIAKETVGAFKNEIASVVNSSASTSVSYGISEFGGIDSETNNALKKYLYAYTAGIDALYPSLIDISAHTWYETIPIYYNGKYRDVKFTFEIVNWWGQKTINIKYAYENTHDKQCFTFFTANKNELANAIRKYATDTYSSAIADYYSMPLDKYVQTKKSVLANLLWDGIQNIGVVGTKSGKKCVKNFIKKGVNDYLNRVETSVRSYSDSISALSLYGAETFENTTNNTPKENIAPLSGSNAEPFSDEYLVSAIKEELELEEAEELTQESLATLEDLNLSASYITDISGLEQCVNLKYLDLSGNAVSDISALSGLTNLETIDLSGNSVSDLKPLSNLTKLQSLTLKSNLVSDLTGLDSLTAISSLDLSFNEITDISKIAPLTNLETLNLTDNNITDISALDELTKLKTLYLGSNNISDVAALSNLNVERLDISSNNISDISNINIEKIARLDISGNYISDISVLQNVNALEELNVADNSIADISSISKNIYISKLNLSKNAISDISIVSNLINLQELECADNYMTDFSVLSNLTHLESLNISYNDVHDLSFIEDLTSLQKLGISDCNLYSTDMEYLPHNIIRLDASSNSITDVSSFVELNDLSELNISNNYVSDILVFSKINHDMNIDLSGNGINDETINDLYEAMNSSPYYINITNQIPDIALEDIYFTDENIKMIVGTTFSQDVSAMPYNANIGELIWESSDSDIAEVNNGVVIGKNVGWATITASTQDGDLYASYNLTVTENMIRNVNIDGNSVFATLENVSDEDYESVTVIIAIYSSDNILQGTKTIAIENFIAGYYNSIQCDFEEIQDNTYAKVFLWESLDSMHPIGTATTSTG